MNALRIACIAAGLMTGAPTPGAAEAQASYGAADPPQVQCHVLLRMDERAPKGTEQQFYTWLQGYVAGRLSAQPDAGLRPLPATGPERKRHYATLLDYCRSHPDANFGAAVQELIRSLAPVTAP